MATPIWNTHSEPASESGPRRLAAVPWEATSLKFPPNWEGSEHQEILDALPVLIFLERAGRIVYANAEARQMLGLTDGVWIPRSVEEVLWGLFPGTAEPQTTLSATRRGSSPFHATLPSKGGRLLPVEGTYSVLSAELHEAVIVAHPSVRERAPKSRLMEDVLASIPEAVVIEHDDHILYTNPAFARMFGYTPEEAAGSDLRHLIVPETRLSEYVMLEKQVDEIGCVTVETVRMNKAGELIDVSLQAAPLLVDNSAVGHVYTFRDIADRKQTEAKLQHDALHDVLTGLPNRALFLDRLSLALSRCARRSDQSCGVLFLDLDRFKEINDTLGHAAGDVLLVTIAERLRSILRPQDSAARLSGDEFAVIVENIVSVSDLDIVARRILREMEKPFEIFGHFVQATVSIGVAMASREHVAPEILIRDADFAMYRAKQSGGGRYEIFDRHLELVVSSQHERERELRQVFEERQFGFVFEPTFRLDTGKLDSFEAHLRRRREDGSLEPFRELMTVAEDTGLTISLGRETLDAVCCQLRDWLDTLPPCTLAASVNLTHRQFYHPDLAVQLRKVLTATAADPGRLLFEIPETVLSDNPDAAVAILQRLVDCGIRIAIDNFGSSLAPLNHLVRLPIDVVKLDPKLTAGAASAGRQQMFLDALLRLTRTCGVLVVAQGIESPEQLAVLTRMGCEFGQGRLLSPPLDTDEATALAVRGAWNHTLAAPPGRA